MSDSGDDWENQLDSDYDEREAQKKKEEEEKKKAAFKDEDAVDTEQIAKQKEDEKKKAIEDQMANARVKESKKVDLDKKFAERQAALAGISTVSKKENVDTANTAGMSSQAKGMVLEKQAEEGLTDQLFGGVEEQPTVFGAKIKLNSEKEYKQFGKQVGDILYTGSAPYRIENFFREVCKDLPDHCDSKQIKKIVEHLTIVVNEKQKKEKEEKDGKSKKKKAPKLQGGGAKGYELNNNPAMINDVMGTNQEGEYGDYEMKKDQVSREKTRLNSISCEQSSKIGHLCFRPQDDALHGVFGEKMARKQQREFEYA